MQFRRLVIRTVAFLLAFITLDMLLGEIVRTAYFSQENKYTFGIQKTKADIIVVGSSRANHHYIPSLFLDTLGKSCFNMGSGGQTIFYYYSIIGSILERYEPKIILMDVMDSDIELRNEDTDRLSELLPFYRDRQSIRELINLRSPYERIKMLSGLYPFNSQTSSVLFSFIKRNENPHLVMGGYIPLDGEISSPIVEAERKEVFTIDSSKVILIGRIVSLCKQHNVKLILITSPTYIKFSGKNQWIKALNDIVSKYGIELWDYEQDPYFISQGALFRDELHLNHSGAVEFSKIISGRIKQEYSRIK